jgi:hypothetical protein
MTVAEHLPQLWLAVYIATLWLVSVGGKAEANADADTPECAIPDIVDFLIQPGCRKRRMRRATMLRLVSVFRRER